MNILKSIIGFVEEFCFLHLGKILFPGTGLLVLVWETFSCMQGIHYTNLPVMFENVQFLRATSLMKNRDVILSVSIHKGIKDVEELRTFLEFF